MLATTLWRRKLSSGKSEYVQLPVSSLDISHDIEWRSHDNHRLEEQGKIDSAMACYREALTFNPEEPTAKERLDTLTVVMETKVCWSLSKEREDCCNLCLSFSLHPFLLVHSGHTVGTPGVHSGHMWGTLQLNTAFN